MESKKVFYTYKFRLYPNSEQIQFLNQEIGNARFVYNYFLDKAISSYKLNKTKFNYNKLAKELTEIKKKYDFLNLSNSQTLQQSLKNLEKAFKNFFEKRNGFPKFKKKKQTNSIIIPITNNNVKIKSLNKKYSLLKIPKLKSLIKFRKHRDILGKIKSISITKTSSGKFYLNILTERQIQNLLKTGKGIGIDVGIEKFCTFSNGTKINNPKYYRKLLKLLRKAQRSLSRKQKGSNNYKKAKAKLTKIHERIVNLRNDFLHKLSFSIVKNYDLICVEDLSIKNMIKNKHLSLSITDASWSKFINYLEYKANWYGKKLIKIHKFFPSSKTCSNCGSVKSELKLSERIFRCTECGFEIDRDLNAAINIFMEGLRLVGAERTEFMPVEVPKAPAKQEAMTIFALAN
jgi:putative transposase